MESSQIYCGYIKYDGYIGDDLVLTTTVARDVRLSDTGYGYQGKLPIKKTVRSQEIWTEVAISPLRLKQAAAVNINEANYIQATIWFENNYEERLEELKNAIRSKLSEIADNAMKSMRSI